jgi:hypothetical protein
MAARVAPALTVTRHRRITWSALTEAVTSARLLTVSLPPPPPRARGARPSEASDV